MMYTYPWIIYIGALASLGTAILMYLARKRMLKKIHVFRHPFTRFVKRRNRDKIKWIINVAASCIIVFLLILPLTTPYTIVTEQMEKTKYANAYLEVQKKMPVVIILDTSGSMGGEKLRIAKAAIKEFINRTSNSLLIGLILFDGMIKAAIPPTSNKYELNNALDRARAYGGTIYSKPLEAALQWIIPYREFNLTGIVIFVTDGFPLPSDIPEYKRVLEEYINYSIPIYGVFIETPTASPGENELGLSTVAEISNVTGGKYYGIKTYSKLYDVFRELAEKALKNSGTYSFKAKISYSIAYKVYELNPYLYIALVSLLTYSIVRFLLYRVTM